MEKELNKLLAGKTMQHGKPDGCMELFSKEN